MRLLLDHNLSPKLKRSLVSLEFTCSHVLDFGLETASDSLIWDFAREQGFCIVTKDRDFLQRSILRGHPPKLIWLSVGNSSTELLHALLFRRSDAITGFLADPVRSALVIR